MGPVDTLLADKGLNDNYGRNRLMKIIKRNSMRLLNLVNQLLDISRLDAGKMKITLTHSDILKDLRILICEFSALQITERSVLILKYLKGCS